MKTTAVTPADLSASVLSVPPLPLAADLSPNEREMRRLVRHIEAGGVSTILWGGNAQLQHWPASRYGDFLALAEATAAKDSWVIPSVGPDYGKLLDEARSLAGTRFPCAMLLPMAAHHTPAGVARGVRDFVQAAGKPAIVYIRQSGYVAPEALGAMVEAGEVCAVKYAVDRPDLRDDPYLASLVATVGAERIVSGAGEIVAVPHLDAFGLAGFTAGCVCIAPALSMEVLRLLKAGDQAAAAPALEAIRPLEGLRERLSPIRVLHEAVRLAGVAETGPIYPMLSNLEAEHHPAIEAALKPLLAAERALDRAPALAG
ncbi:MAG: dihydrodipicolinate synthase family protein [Geminicoccaceae bacterium]